MSYQGMSQFMHGNCKDLVIILFRFQSQWTEVDIASNWSTESIKDGMFSITKFVLGLTQDLAWLCS